MTNEQAIANSVARLREADNEAHASRLAFATGRFGEYMAAKIKAIEKRLGDEYDSYANAEGGSGEAAGGGGSVFEDSGAGGGTTGPSTDARVPREEG